MKVIILAGGFGTRLSEYTHRIPKPMVNIPDRPILHHIMQRYSSFGHNDFYIALGYKAEVIKEYFLNIGKTISDSSNHLSICVNKNKSKDSKWHVTLVDTGQTTLTGGRVKQMQNFIDDEPFMLTYGDGLADIDFHKLLKFHNQHGKLVTVSAVRPVARFGELKIDGNKVISFKEKPQVTTGWINGGFFICKPKFFDLIKDDDQTVLEAEPLEQAASMEQLMAYKHEGFWQCMDNKRDKDLLAELWSSGKAPWKI